MSWYIYLRKSQCTNFRRKKLCLRFVSLLLTITLHLPHALVEGTGVAVQEA